MSQNAIESPGGATASEQGLETVTAESLQTQCGELQEALRLNAFRMEALLALSRMSGASFQEITDFALEQAVVLTKSQMGYLAFLNEDESILTMHAWSKNAMAQCRMVDKPIVYPVKGTGLWGEAVRQRRPIVTNDYQAPSPLKKGCPAGHVPIQRHMNVPVFSGERIVAVAGVGNKPEPYDDSDVRQLTLLMEGMWTLIERHRTETELARYRNHLEELVAQRNGELVAANEELEQTNEQLQEQILQREAADQEVRRQRDEIRKYLDIAGTVFIVLDLQGHVKLLNRKGYDILGYPQGSLLAKDWFATCVPERVRKANRAVFLKLLKGETKGCEWVESAVVTCQGEERIVAWHNSILRDDTGTITGTLSSGEDFTDRRKMEDELVQAHKLEAVGRLAAGIAHEINTPIQYIGDNVRFLSDCWQTLHTIGEFCSRVLETIEQGGLPREMVDRAEALAEHLDFGYVQEEIPRAIGQSLEGLERVAQLVSAMKEFAHPGTQQMQAIDLNRALENTVTISRNEWKYVADVVTDFDPLLPLVRCLPGEINQVFLNLIVNAAQAIGELAGDKGTITVSTRLLGEAIEVRIRDTGAGIPPEIHDKIFDPFFTTKPVGKGTGQGLALAHAIVVKKHGGSLRFETPPNGGTVFIVRLPVQCRVGLNGQPAGDEAAGQQERPLVLP